jgi:uncharacterized membrane protein
MSSKDLAPDPQSGGEPLADREPLPDRAPLPDRRPLPGRRPAAPDPVARVGHLEYDRILFFSDAIFAIAITLLVAGLVVGVNPHGTAETGRELRDAFSGIEAFIISFAVIGLFWTGHHSMFRYITAVDRRLIFLNLLFLGVIAFLPYPTELISSTLQAPSVIFYAACCSAAGLAEAGCWLYATRSPAGLAVPPAATGRRRSALQVMRDAVVHLLSIPVTIFSARPATELAVPGAAIARRPYLLQTLRVPVIFLLSIPVAIFYSPRLATYSWILIWVTGVLLNHLAPIQVVREELN